MLNYHRFIVNMVRVNSYLVWDEHERTCLIIDPGFSTPSEENTLLRVLDEHKLQLTRCICTHLHFDHIWGAQFIYNNFGIPIEVPQPDIVQLPDFRRQMMAFGLPDIGDSTSYATLPLPEFIRFGAIEMKVMHTPGHSPGHVCFYDECHGVLFSGDVLFQGGYGRYDLWGGDQKTLMSSIQELLALPPSTKVLPGHGEETTINAELLHF